MVVQPRGRTMPILGSHREVGYVLRAPKFFARAVEVGLSLRAPVYRVAHFDKLVLGHRFYRVLDRTAQPLAVRVSLAEIGRRLVRLLRFAAHASVARSVSR